MNVEEKERDCTSADIKEHTRTQLQIDVRHARYQKLKVQSLREHQS